MKNAATTGRGRIVRIAGVLLLLLLAMNMGRDYALSQIAFVATYAIAGLGICLLIGQCGQISLGQGGLLGLGAYTQTLLTLQGLPSVLALVLASVVGALAGGLISLPARRLGGLYFALSTLAFALIFEEGLSRWETLTAGAAGLAVPSFAIGHWQANSALAQAVVSCALWLLALRCCHCWCQSGAGRRWRAIREDEDAAAACGIDPAGVKLQVFMASGGLSGLSGGLYAHWIGFVSPEQFGLLLSFELLVLGFIGGASRLRGALWGALVIVALPQFIAMVRDLLPPEVVTPAGLETMLFGLIIVAIVLLRPQGIAAGAAKRRD